MDFTEYKNIHHRFYNLCCEKMNKDEICGDKQMFSIIVNEIKHLLGENNGEYNETIDGIIKHEINNLIKYQIIY